MKKTLLAAFSLIMAMQISAQNETIIGWSFPTGVDSVDINANLGLESNSKYYISAEDTTAWPETIMRNITMDNGSGEDGDFAAGADGWNDGENAKVWSIKFKAKDYVDLKVSSKQRSGGNKPGPKNWKLQCRLKDGEWVDIPNGTIEVANDWTTGVVEDLALPAEFNNYDNSMFIRWIVTDNLSSDGINDVAANGTSKIDDVVITGTCITGVKEQIELARVSVYPNPANDYFNVVSSTQIEKIIVCNSIGSIVKTVLVNTSRTSIAIDDLNEGIYFVSTYTNEANAPSVSKLIVK
ncbi:MAG: T9SS type A sorting domain-containing protein [Salinivirgaceae bacterium]|nr:T9SS type A sorting domain-containing protein [Salinivirgaceae bacterium]